MDEDNIVLEEKIEIYPPVKIQKSKVYGLVFTDKTRKTYYFNKDGTYDGWSRECNICEN